jgi:hypothetical protein
MPSLYMSYLLKLFAFELAGRDSRAEQTSRLQLFKNSNLLPQRFPNGYFKQEIALASGSFSANSNAKSFTRQTRH